MKIKIRRISVGCSDKRSRKTVMFAITGITGRVGGIVARTLLTAKEPVRAIVRDAGKGAPWLERGCELALAEMNDAAALAAAFEGAEGIFVLPPPIFDPEPGFPEARATATAVRSALEATHPSKSCASRQSARRQPAPICSPNSV